jgi:hypothetical protein
MSLDVSSHELSRFPALGSSPGPSGNPHWHVALSRALGRKLDGQAERVLQMANALPRDATLGEVMRVNAEATLMQVMAQSAAKVNDSIGQGLEALARR